MYPVPRETDQNSSTCSHNKRFFRKIRPLVHRPLLQSFLVLISEILNSSCSLNPWKSLITSRLHQSNICFILFQWMGKAAWEDAKRSGKFFSYLWGTETKNWFWLTPWRLIANLSLSSPQSRLSSYLRVFGLNSSSCFSFGTQRITVKPGFHKVTEVAGVIRIAVKWVHRPQRLSVSI